VLGYQTLPFGGNNPVFIPYETEEQKYEERYIYNGQQEARDAQQAHDVKVKKLKKVHNDVNFIKNLSLNEMPTGFGSFQSTVEIDALYARMEAGVAMAQAGIVQSDGRL